MNRNAKSILGWTSLAGAMVAGFMVWITIEQEQVANTSPAPTESVSYMPTPTDEPIRIEFIDGIPTAVQTVERASFSETCSIAPTSTPTVVPATATPTQAPTAAQERTPTPKPTNTPVPTKKTTQAPKTTYTKGTAGTRYAETNGTHAWKPWARHTAVTDKSSPQWRLEQIAETNEIGIRVVKDPNGEYRYLVALPVYWAGGTYEDIGRCVDIVMVNGATLKCVLADTKKIEHSQNGEGKYGAHGELIEVICEKAKLAPAVRNGSDASRLGAEWEGEVEKVIAYDMFINGF